MSTYTFTSRDSIIKRAKPIIIVGAIMSVAVTSILLCYTLFGFGLSCMVHSLTGFSCPTCGCTRMAIAILHGNIHQAFRYNPFVFITFPVVGIVTCISVYRYVFYGYLYKHIDKLMITYAIMLLAFGIIRNIPMFNWLLPTTI